jgi:hypothetical protein
MKRPMLRVEILFVLAMLAGTADLRWIVAADVDKALPARSHRLPLLMPDDFSDMHLVDWRVEPGVNDPNNPLIEGEMPWDRGGVGIHGSVFFDPIASCWRAYLVCTPAEEFPEKQPENLGKPWASENHAHRRVCLFESQDGIHWVRPRLVNVSFGDEKSTNIIFDVTDGVSAYSSILLDPSNSNWPYEMFVLRESWVAVRGKPPEGNGYYRYRSRDGKSWERVGGKVAGPMTGDLCFFYHPSLRPTPQAIPFTGATAEKSYVAYYRLGSARQPTDHVPLYEDFPRRSCFRATSADSLAWVKDPAMLLTGDERDHRDTQYQECVPLPVQGGFVGMVTMYHPLTQTLDLRIAASRDGSTWWFPDRRACLPNAPLGDYGGGMIWQTQYPVVDGQMLHIYYGGTEGAHRQIHDTRSPSKAVSPLESVVDHGAHFLPFNAALCRASWRYDRLYALASSAGGPTLGVATTASRDLGGAQLRLNCTTRPPKKASRPGLDEGYIQVELLDAAGLPLPGFTRDDSPLLRGDHSSLTVSWKGGDKAPAKARQARFFLKRAFLYGFEFGPPKAAA